MVIPAVFVWITIPCHTPWEMIVDTFCSREVGITVGANEFPTMVSYLDFSTFSCAEDTADFRIATFAHSYGEGLPP